MQKYNEIISRLTEVQKVRLLTDFSSLADAELSALKLPCVRSANVGDADCYPSPSVMARAWDTELASEVSFEICCRLAEDGATQVVMPAARAGIGKKQGSLSEDPLIAKKMAGAYLAGADRAGIAAAVEGYGSKSNKYNGYPCDRPISARAIYEQLTEPYADMISHGKCQGIIAEDSMPVDKLITDLGVPIIRRWANDEDTVSAICRGEILLRGSSSALQNALHIYRHLHSGIERGKSSTGELEKAVASGEAISPEALNSALERLLNFAYSCSSLAAKPSARGMDAEQEPEVSLKRKNKKTAFVARKLSLSERAICESTVLLENRNGILPLTGKQRVGVIGDAAIKFGGDAEQIGRLLASASFSYTGFARGYDIDRQRSEELLDEANKIARMSDTVLLFLSTDASDRTDAIPANQLALCEMLGRMGKNVVVVISSDGDPDMGFASQMATMPSAIMLSPIKMTGGIYGALSVIVGDMSPSGRLTKTLVDRRSPANNRKGFAVGPFSGYRYYDTVGEGAIYPFGHGLGYTEFKYSSIHATSDTVTFTVKNVGKRTGIETAQVYLGMGVSAVLRPTKELVGWTRIELAPGERKSVSIKLPDTPIYDTESGKAVQERGAYTVYVGASVSDIKLTTSVFRIGSEIRPDDGSASDHLPSVSNIFKEHYTLEAEYTPMKSTLRNLIVGISAMLLAVAVKAYDIITISGSAFLNIIAVVLAIGSIIFFILDIADRRKKFAIDKKRAEEASEEVFKDAERISVPSAEALFEKYDQDDAEDDEEEEDRTVVSDSDEKYDFYNDVDKSFTFEMAAQELSTFAKEKGIALDKQTAIEIFASFAASRLVIVRGMSESNFAMLNSLLCEYFGCPVGVDVVNENYVKESDMLFAPRKEEYASREPRAAFGAIQSANSKIRNIHIVALSSVVLSDMSAYFAPFARFVRSPYSANTLNMNDQNGRELSIHLPENLWFMLNVKEGDKLENIPEYAAEMSTVSCWSMEKVGEESSSISNFRAFRYGQMLYLCDKARLVFSIDENTWKKLDRVETFARKYSDFKFGNKMWLGLEAYLAVLMSAGCEEASAMDKAVSVKLMPALIQALQGKISRDERGLGETLDSVFGDENTVACRGVIKTSEANII